MVTVVSSHAVISDPNSEPKLKLNIVAQYYCTIVSVLLSYAFVLNSLLTYDPDRKKNRISITNLSNQVVLKISFAD